MDLKKINRDLDKGDRVLFVSVRNRNVRAHEYHGEKRRLNSRSIASMIEKHGRAAGIPREELNPHAMRHLFGTELAEHDVDLLKRQTLLGHVSPSSTEIYTHLALRSLAKVVDKANPLQRINTPVSDIKREMVKTRSTL